MNRQTIGKRMAAKLSDLQVKLRERMHAVMGDTLEWLQSVVGGYFQYHAIPGNEERLRAFRKDVLRLWLRQLRRRRQRSRWTWERFQAIFGVLLGGYPNPAPVSRRALRRQNPRQEPCALAAPAQVCAGGSGLTAVPTATSRLFRRLVPGVSTFLFEEVTCENNKHHQLLSRGCNFSHLLTLGLRHAKGKIPGSSL